MDFGGTAHAWHNSGGPRNNTPPGAVTSGRAKGHKAERTAS
jgi:hypothetical protein